MRPFLVRRTVARTVLRLTRWRAVGTVPRKGVLVGAPHTSNWDWVAALMLTWSQGLQPMILIKKEFFVGPLGPILRATGGVALDRTNPGATVRELLAGAEGDESFLLAIAAEGTRSRTEYWKSGFYRIAKQTGLPIALGYVDGPSRTVGCGETFQPTGDVTADMDRVRAFYADKRGINPGRASIPRLREEGPAPSEG